MDPSPLPPMHTGTCAQTHAHRRTVIRTYARECRVYTHAYARAHTHTHTYSHIHVHTHMYTYTHAHMYTYAHTHKANGYLSWRIRGGSREEAVSEGPSSKRWSGLGLWEARGWENCEGHQPPGRLHSNPRLTELLRRKCTPIEGESGSTGTHDLQNDAVVALHGNQINLHGSSASAPCSRGPNPAASSDSTAGGL